MVLVARAVDEEEVRKHTPNNEADDDSTPSFSNGNKASEECTNWDECQAKDQSEMFHETHRLSSLERIYAETFLSLQEIDARSPEISHMKYRIDREMHCMSETAHETKQLSIVRTVTELFFRCPFSGRSSRVVCLY